MIKGVTRKKSATALIVESEASCGWLGGWLGALLGGWLDGLLAVGSVTAPAKLARAGRCGKMTGVLPDSFTACCKSSGEAIEIAGSDLTSTLASMLASMLGILSGASDRDRTEAKLGDPSGESCEFGKLLVDVMESAVACAAESELEMDTVAIGLMFAARRSSRDFRRVEPLHLRGQSRARSLSGSSKA